MSKPPVTHRQLSRCQACGKLVHREDLVNQTREWGEPRGSNYLLHSSYASSFWACDATDAGRISIGPYEGARVKWDLENTGTEVDGSQTWTGTGTLRTITAVDGSDWTSLVFACVVGPYHQPTADPSITYSIGLCDSSGTVITTEQTYTAQLGQRTVWFTKNIVDIAAPSTLYFYVTVTPATDESWYVDMARLEKDKTAPDVFLETTGAAIDHTVANTSVLGNANVCPDCRMKVFDRWATKPPAQEKYYPVPVERLTRESR